MFTNDKQDDVEMLRQLRLLYMRSNKIIRKFHFCTIDEIQDSRFKKRLFVIKAYHIVYKL